MQSVPEYREMRNYFCRGQMLRAWSSPFLIQKQADIS
jgi:hypothetical protein